MVRGPTIADVTPGWATAKAIAMCVSEIPAFSASGSSSSTMSSLRSWVSRPGANFMRALSVSWPFR